MNVLVIGTGYVGLVTGVCLAHTGHRVLCVDKDSVKINALQRGRVPIYETGLESLLHTVLVSGHISFGTEVPVPAEFEVAIIAVGTPATPDGSADLSAVFDVIQVLGANLTLGSVVATKSTVPVGTAQKIKAEFQSTGRSDLHVASVPEFLREGTAIHDTLHPSRLVFGVGDLETEQVLRELHAGINAPTVVCDRSTAEMIKYASNAFLATKISFINEIANICDRVAADVSQVAMGMGLDPRIGKGFLRAGLGYGGSCFPKDTRALVNIAGNVEYDFKLLKAVVEVNQTQRLAPVYWLSQQLKRLENKSITLLGVAFKPGTDDIRESPALDIGSYLAEAGALVTYCDPLVRTFLSPHNGQEVHVEWDPCVGLTDADAFVLITEWNDYVNLDWSKVRDIMRAPFGFDGRNVLNVFRMKQLGFVMSSVGRHSVSAETTFFSDPVFHAQS